MKLKNSNCDETQHLIVKKKKKSNCDETHSDKNSKTQIVIKLKN